MSQNIKFKTTLPISYFVWITSVVITSILLFFFINFIQAIVLTITFSLVSYLTICRGACQVFVFEQKMKLRFYSFFIFEKEVVFKKNMAIEYELGYYYYFTPEHKLAPMQFFHPYDTVFFYEINEINKTLFNTVRINTSYSGLKDLRFFLANHNQ